ncbi:MAG: hypothetical protein DMG26_13395, partial [Acidobacteria bacterium]
MHFLKRARKSTADLCLRVEKDDATSGLESVCASVASESAVPNFRLFFGVCYNSLVARETGVERLTGDPHRTYEIRCPVHGFVRLNDWELGIISQPTFQRLRRIRQLAWTDLVYPGAMHTRFEHSLGVMHTATLLYESISRKSAEVLKRELNYTDGGIERHKQLVRLAALLHDIGHAPFSHAAEDLFPTQGEGRRKF